MKAYYRPSAFVKAIQCTNSNIAELESLGYQVTGSLLDTRGWVYLGKAVYADAFDYIVWEGNNEKPVVMSEERFHALYIATHTCEGCEMTVPYGEPCSCAFGDCECWKCEKERTRV